ncbi:MAG: sulfatase-like hydrolase/transferase [Marinilabiliales bacterium]|nr:sulfatase-like hydrolase/transferase [Marinilabiliales bacterium]
MKQLLNKLGDNRYGILFWILIIFLLTSFLSRTVLLTLSFGEANTGILQLATVYLLGLFFDLTAFSYFMIPIVLLLLFLPDKALKRSVMYLLFFITFFIIFFNGVAEYFFWDEFGVRYNFIAVDYLVYTTEVLGNINESYPIPYLVAAILSINLLAIYLLVRTGKVKRLTNGTSQFRQRLKTSAILLVFPLFAYLTVNYSWAEKTGNRYNNELSKNGIYSLFAAFFSNELDYETFYVKRENPANFERLKTLLKSSNSSYTGSDTYDITRHIANVGEEKRHNVIFITVESLSGEFLEYLGSKKGKLTPGLDTLVKKSLLFTNFYAVGTRTIWGLEAVALSAPPKPGQSVIKRANNENMFSLGQIFKQKGYTLKFIYGGYGYFDNMNYFFEHNGYSIIDHSDLSKDEITFSNAWGVCDQDLFNKVLKESDQSFAEGKPFLNLAMTTSNHRPFTYPEGVVDIPSGTNREGAVKYCDYAITEFIRKASAKPWFNNTLFVIMADHCAGSAGQTELPFMDYRIPFIVYNPGLVTPQQIDKQCSQIDVGPTLLGILNWSYDSKFFGKDILKMAPDEERAFIANYQKLGYIRNNQLTILSPQQKCTFYTIDREKGSMEPQAKSDSLLMDAVTYYQSANYLYKNKLNKWK